MKVFYGSNAERKPQGAIFRNARFFETRLPDATTVYLDGDYPEIETAYRAADVQVIRLDAVAPAPLEPGEDLPVNPVSIPADWRELPWTHAADERGLTLRGLAAEVSEEPIRSKDEAVAAIETYLAGDLDRPLKDAQGLTRRELNADLESLGLPIIPDEEALITWDRVRVAKLEKQGDQG